MGDYVLGQAGLGPAHDEREVITLLAEHGWIDPTLGEDLKRTGEFCRAEWDYQGAPLPALVTIIKRGLDDFENYARALLARAAAADGADGGGATAAKPGAPAI
jgi:hypothetical protein